jgi:predicted transcriptional regulator
MVAAMTKILEEAIAKVRALPAEDQDFLGAVLLALADEELTRIGDLDDETRAAVREGLEQARRGDFVPREEIEALWQRFGL